MTGSTGCRSHGLSTLKTKGRYGMNFINHSDLAGTHAFLSPSQNAWTNYSDEKLVQRYLSAQAVERGTRLHEFAAEAIRLNRRLGGRDTLSMHVNDAIGYKMTPEQTLFYSYNCYGTTDAIAYKRNVLRIHDLKTGEVEAHIKQLYIYAALFCLEYGLKANELRKKGYGDNDIARYLGVKANEIHFEPEKMDDIILRIYQFNEVKEEHPDPQEIRGFMNIIINHDRVLSNLKAEE